MAGKILIVDDEIFIRDLIEQTLEDLEDEGVALLTASNGNEALEIVKAEQPQLIFLDVMMPYMNGFEVCRRVKHDLGLTDTYIVILTAKGQEYDKIKGDEVGADIYMTKPFDPDKLLKTAEAVLGL